MIMILKVNSLSTNFNFQVISDYQMTINKLFWSFDESSLNPIVFDTY